MERTFLEIVLILSSFPLPTSKLREDTPTLNHLQFQDTRIYLLKLVELVKVFAILQSSCDCTLP